MELRSSLRAGGALLEPASVLGRQQALPFTVRLRCARFIVTHHEARNLAEIIVGLDGMIERVLR